MILGILSDSHGQHLRTRRAIGLLQRLEATTFIHCGDVQTPSVLDELAVVGAHFVWGNVDFPDTRSARYAESLGLAVPTEIPLRLELDGKTIGVFHGHERAFERLSRALAGRDETLVAQAAAGCDYVLHGHTHEPCDLRIGSVRVINPGALQRAVAHTVATLDLQHDALEFWQVTDDSDADAPPRRFRLS